MSASVFPLLPARSMNAERETIYSMTVHETPSGKEDRTVWSSTPRYKWRVRFNGLRSAVAAPSPWGSYNELSVVQYFFDTHVSTGDTFHFTDPYDGTTDRVVRFNEPTFSLTRIADGLWRCEFELLSVL